MYSREMDDCARKRRALAREGCAKGQGYLFAKPVRLAQLPPVVAAAARFVRDDGPSIAPTARAIAAA
jgi:hypothetical protein